MSLLYPLKLRRRLEVRMKTTQKMKVKVKKHGYPPLPTQRENAPQRLPPNLHKVPISSGLVMINQIIEVVGQN